LLVQKDNCLLFRGSLNTEAFHWPNENFTRLVLGRCHGDALSLVIGHEPMKMSYESPLEYIRIISPILIDEWKTLSSSFQVANTIVGNVSSCAFIEETTIKGKLRNVYAIEITGIEVSKVWNIEKKATLRRATLEISLKNNLAVCCLL